MLGGYSVSAHRTKVLHSMSVLRKKHHRLRKMVLHHQESLFVRGASHRASSHQVFFRQEGGFHRGERLLGWSLLGCSWMRPQDMLLGLCIFLWDRFVLGNPKMKMWRKVRREKGAPPSGDEQSWASLSPWSMGLNRFDAVCPDAEKGKLGCS